MDVDYAIDQYDGTGADTLSIRTLNCAILERAIRDLSSKDARERNTAIAWFQGRSDLTELVYEDLDTEMVQVTFQDVLDSTEFTARAVQMIKDLVATYQDERIYGKEDLDGD